MTKKNELIIDPVFTPQGKIKQHVIFIHGLDGDLYETWQSEQNVKEFWPGWLFQDISHLAVWTIGYPASKSRWFNGQAMHVTDRGRSLYQAIKLKPLLKVGEITFVGHSMGGLLIKQIIREADAEAKSDQGAVDFLNRIRKVAFIGTPHTGAFLSSLAKFGRIIAKPSAATYSLGVDDPYLRDLNFFYRKIAKYNSISHLILQETQKLPVSNWLPFIKIQIVSFSSSDPGLDIAPTPVDANHESICKPHSKNSPLYESIVDFLNSEDDKTTGNLRVEEKLDKSIGLTEGLSAKIDSLDLGRGLVDFKLFDNEIDSKLQKLRQQRFFGNFPVKDFSEEILEDVVNGYLSSGSAEIRSVAIAWCVRLLSVTPTNKDLDKYLNVASELYSCPEVDVAQGFLCARAKIDIDEVISTFIQSPIKLKRSAGLIIFANNKSINECLNWYKQSKFSSEYFDSDGLINLFKFSLHENDWDLLNQLIEQEKSGLITDSPALCHLIALAYLTHAISEPLLRNVVINTIPIGHFPLSSDDQGIDNRRNAIRYFDKAATLALEFDLVTAGEYNKDFSLWLKLQDNHFKEEAQRELANSMREDADLMLRRFPIAVHFLEQEINLASVEQEINSLTSKSLGKSYTASLARYSFLLNLTSYTKASKVHNYLINNRKQLEICAPENDLIGLEIELLINMGEIQKAELKLTELKQSCSDYKTIDRFENILHEVRGEDQITLAINQFCKTDDISDLNHLVKRLQKKADFELLDEYSTQLFERTKSVEHAEIYLDTKQGLQKFFDIKNFFLIHPEYIEQSVKLEVHLCWSLLRDGELDNCKQLLVKIKTNTSNYAITQLEIQLAIASGDWDSLSRLIEEVWQSREEKPINELIQFAKLASVILPKRAKGMVEYIATKEQQNPEVLLSAYSLATEMGWENEKDVGGWLNKAINLSGSDGPIKKITLQEMADSMPDWRVREDKLLDLLNDMKAPVHTVAQSLNRTLVSFYLSPFLVNESQQDLRFMQPIPAYASLRPIVVIKSKIMALDASTVLTLGKLGELDNMINYFDQVIIPHSMLYWLFNEIQKSVFHQPSQINKAKDVHNYIADRKIEVVNSILFENAELGLEIGNELATLIEIVQKDNAVQSLVVRSLPIMKSGSFMQESADVEKYSDKIIECNEVVKALRLYGHISEQEEIGALNFLSQHELNKVSGIILEKNARLYLDNLSISYFQSAELLDKLVNSSFEVLIHESTARDGANLIKHETHNKQVCEVLESIRESLERALRSNKVSSATVNYNEHDVSESDFILLSELFKTGAITDGVVIDDRCLNQHLNFKFDSTLVPTYTSLDILNTICVNGIISVDIFMGHISNLRKAHFHFIPFSQDELNYWLDKAKVEGGKLIEGQELANIRKYLAKLKMSNSMKLPRDASWLVNTLREISTCLKNGWLLDLPESYKKSRSNWLLNLLDYRGWASFHEVEAGEGLAVNGEAILVNSLILFNYGDLKAQKAYWQWLDEQVLEPLKENDPETFERVVNLAKQEMNRQMQDDKLWNQLEN